MELPSNFMMTAQDVAGNYIRFKNNPQAIIDEVLTRGLDPNTVSNVDLIEIADELVMADRDKNKLEELRRETEELRQHDPLWHNDDEAAF